MKGIYKLKIYTDKAIRWRWRLVSANGEIVGCSSQSFHDKTEAKENFNLLRRCIVQRPGD